MPTSRSLFLSVVALVVALAASACSAESTPPGTASEAASIDPQIAGGILGVLCNETAGNPIGKYVVDAVGGGLPDSDKAGAALCDEAKGRPTAECNDYCEARSPSGLGADVAKVLSYASFSSYIPAKYWAQVSNYLTDGNATETDAGVVQCATIVGWAAAEFYYAGKACERGSECATCDETSTSVRSGCLIGQTVLRCAQALGFTPPPEAKAISAACSVGLLCGKGILMEGCRRSCAASLPAAAPIAEPVTTDDGTTIRCCTCERSTYEDIPLLSGGDELLSSDYYYSPVSDYDGNVSECEGKEKTTTDIAGGRGPKGHGTYYYYKNCHKARYDGATCPQGNGYVAPSKLGQMIRSRQDAGYCLTNAGAGQDVSVAPCDLKDAAQRWSILQKDRSDDERTIVVRPLGDPSLCVDMSQTDLVQGNGYRAYLNSCDGGASQQFVDKGGQLLQRYTLDNYCIDWWVGNGGTVHMPTCHTSAYFGMGTAGPNQLWDIVDP